jgi:uncharacterized protein
VTTPAGHAPVPGPDDQFFWDGVARGELLIRVCSQCGRHQHPPSPMCPNCGATTWATHPASGRGTVHSWIVSKHPTEPEALARVVALIELEEGVRLVSNLQGVAVAEIVNDMPVEVVFTDAGGVRLPQFRPVGATA